MNSHAELNQIEDALVGAAARLAGSPARRPRMALMTGVLVALVIAGAAVAGAAGEGPLADQLHGMFGADAAPPAPAVLTPSGEESKVALGIPPPAPGHVLLPAAGKQHVNVYAYEKDGKVCLVVSGGGGIGHCVEHLQEAGGHLSVGLGVVDGEAFVFGLAADDVKVVTVRVDGHDLTATLANSAFFAALPSQQVASNPITVTARLADGSWRVAHMPGLPAPIAPEPG